MDLLGNFYALPPNPIAMFSQDPNNTKPVQIFSACPIFDATRVKQWQMKMYLSSCSCSELNAGVFGGIKSSWLQVFYVLTRRKLSI